MWRKEKTRYILIQEIFSYSRVDTWLKRYLVQFILALISGDISFEEAKTETAMLETSQTDIFRVRLSDQLLYCAISDRHSDGRRQIWSSRHCPSQTTMSKREHIGTRERMWEMGCEAKSIVARDIKINAEMFVQRRILFRLHELFYCPPVQMFWTGMLLVFCQCLGPH